MRVYGDETGAVDFLNIGHMDYSLTYAAEDVHLLIKVFISVDLTI